MRTSLEIKEKHEFQTYSIHGDSWAVFTATYSTPSVGKNAVKRNKEFDEKKL